MLQTNDGTEVEDLDAFVADNGNTKPLFLISDVDNTKKQRIPGVMLEKFFDCTYTYDCYPGWLQDLGWKMVLNADGDVKDCGPGDAVPEGYDVYDGS